DPAVPIPWSTGLKLQFMETNVYAGQPIPVRVLMPAGQGNVVQMFQQIQQLKLNGEGFVTDASATRPTIIANVIHEGQQTVAYVYDMLFTSLASGKVTATAQGFAPGQNRVEGPFIGRGPIQYTLV